MGSERAGHGWATNTFTFFHLIFSYLHGFFFWPISSQGLYHQPYTTPNSTHHTALHGVVGDGECVNSDPGPWGFTIPLLAEQTLSIYRDLYARSRPGKLIWKNTFYWNIVDLQCGVPFLCTAKWISLYSFFRFFSHIVEKEMAIHSSILAWRILWTKEPGGLVHGVTKSGTWLGDFHFHFSHTGHYWVLSRLLCAIVVQPKSCVRLFATPWTIAHKASLSLTISWSSPMFMSIELVISVQVFISYLFYIW